MIGLLAAAVVLGVAAVVLLAILLARRGDPGIAALGPRLETLEKLADRLERVLRDELSRAREEQSGGAKGLREEVGASLAGLRDGQVTTMSEFSRMQGERFQSFAQDLARLVATNELKLDALRAVVEERLTTMQSENAKKLDEMRRTVDEQLQGTLEKRLGESFKLVSERLEQVHKGLGEMQNLATGVGDLKRMLTNVKSRGGWGEAQLAKLLEDALTREQYDVNVATRPGSNDRVEFAVRLPGRGDGESVVHLPIDAKFPKEDYERLLDAAERADADGMEAAGKALEARIKDEAWDISEKYLEPPHTTDVAILFVPSEGLYAEVLRRPGLVGSLQRDCRTMVAGPTTLWAILNSLQMGFRTLAIEQRSSEVWAVLGAVKTEFGKFGDVLSKVKRKLDLASDEIDRASTRTRAISKTLRGVEEMPASEARRLLGPGAIGTEAEGDAEDEESGADFGREEAEEESA